MENSSISYSLLGAIALEFRLSLDNICKIFERPATEKFKMYFYENIKQTAIYNSQLLDEYNYLFFHETSKESSKAAFVSYTAAKNYIERYKKAKKEENTEKLDEIRNELYKTDRDFRDLKYRIHDKDLTLEDVAIISRYRIRHVISRETIARDYEISDRTLKNGEIKLSSNILKEKLNALSDYYLNFVNNRLRKRAK